MASSGPLPKNLNRQEVHSLRSLVPCNSAFVNFISWHHVVCVPEWFSSSPLMQGSELLRKKKPFDIHGFGYIRAGYTWRHFSERYSQIASNKTILPICWGAPFQSTLNLMWLGGVPAILKGHNSSLPVTSHIPHVMVNWATATTLTEDSVPKIF